VALSVSMTGSGTIGGVLPGWSITEQATPCVPGDTRGGFGSASLRAWAKPDSRFVQDNEIVLESPAGTTRGRVSEARVGARADLSVAGALQFLNVDKTLPPVWLDQGLDLTLASYGSGTGQIGRVVGVAVDPVDGGYLVSSQDTVDGADRHKIIKFSSAGAYVTEFGSLGSGNGQIGQFGATVAVSPVDQSVWIGDLFNLRIQKFTTADGGLTYSYSTKVGSSGSGNGQFGSSSAYISVAVDSSGNVYASDRGNARIQKFTSAAAYSAQVAVGTAPDTVYAIAVDGSDQILAGIRAASGTIGQVNTYNSSLVLQSTTVLEPPATVSSGILSLSSDPNGGTWVVWFGASFAIHYDAAWNETFRWYGSQIQFVAAGTAGVVVYLFSSLSTALRRVVAFDYDPVPLSSAIERYMEACDPLLNGYTLDYQAAVDPDVVFPGWSGNVWANLKELFAIYNVELVQDAATLTFIVRDIGSETIEINNPSPAITRPINLTGGRVVDVIYQQPRAGGGVVWDAATENVDVSISAGARDIRVLYTVNHPAELGQPVPTDTLPIQPGQYYVVDSDGTPVPAATWLAAGGAVNLEVGVAPGTISATITGPTSEPVGYTSPYYFATGVSATSTPALSIVGNGTFCTPATFVRAESQGSPFASPFMDTLDRVCGRGHYASLRSPDVEISFTCPSADLPGIGVTAGCLFPFEESVYRITEVVWGNLTSRVTAERHVTLQNIDDLWAGETLEAFDTFWSGYSLGDIQIQPLRT
jgi:hypothetical protein